MEKISGTIRRLFPDDFNEVVPSQRPWWQKLDFDALMSGGGLKILSLAVAIFLVFSIFYWNRIIDLETNVITDYHQVEVYLQARKDMMANLARTVLDYAQHEREMFRYVVDQQGHVKGSAIQDKLGAFLKQNNITDISKVSGEKLENFLKDFNALAENYPQLRLNENFQTLMNALIDLEGKIAERRMIYNQANNIYETYIDQIPQCIYARLFFRRTYPFIKVDKDVKTFNRVTY